MAFENGPLAAGETAPAMARHYIGTLGLSCITCEPNGKKPSDNWMTQVVTVDDCDRMFDPRVGNIGVRLGAASRGLVDCDLDWKAATPVADFLLSVLPSFGRPSKPRSHRLVLCPEALTVKECKQVQFKLPSTMKGNPNLPSEHSLCVAELRGNGQYTVFPGSTYGAAEPVTWGGDGGMHLPTISWKDVRDNLGLSAMLAVFAQFYPPSGVRNDFSLALGGTLCMYLARRAKADGSEDDEIAKRVDALVGIVCQYGGDKGSGRSWTERARQTLAKMRAGAAVSGMPTAVRLAGLPKECAALFWGWLGADAYDERPHVLWDGMHLTETLDGVEQHMIAQGVPMYQQGGRLVHTYRLDRMDENDGVRHPAGSIVVRSIPDPRLLEYMGDKLQFTKRVRNKKTGEVTEVEIDPPPPAARHFLARGDRWHMPVLKGICETPTLRQDGTLLAVDGYDPQSCLLLDTNGVAFPRIPDQPTREDAEAALALLKEPLKDFPFVPDPDEPAGGRSASRSVALSAMLSGLTRRTMRACPMHAFTAPTMATGKSLLCDVVSLTITGKVATTMSQGEDEAEMEKRLGGVLLQGDSLLVIDNIDHPLEGKFLCSVLSQEAVQVRVLGETGQHPVSTNLLMMANGNNIVMARDITTRVIMCRLNSGLENPEKRFFDRDLKTWVPENRPALVAAGLTMLRAYVCAGRPAEGKLRNSENFARFEDWSGLVRGALVWLGEPDPVNTRDAVAASDPAKETLAGVLLALRGDPDHGVEGIGAEPFTARQLADLAPANPELRKALESALPHGVTARGISLRMAEWSDKIVDGWSIARLPARHGIVSYRLAANASAGREDGTLDLVPGVADKAHLEPADGAGTWDLGRGGAYVP